MITHMKKGDFFMLGPWYQHNEYVVFVLTELKKLAVTDPERIFEYQEIISKMLILDLDSVKEIIEPLYSKTGRPALCQQQLFRSHILRLGLKLSITEFYTKLLTNPVVRTLAGFTRDSLPGIGTFYDFVDRVYPIDDAPIIRSPYPKLKEKPKKGEKLPPKNPQITATLADMIINNPAHFESLIKRRQERYLQKIFASVSLNKSVELGIILFSFSTSGDGTCIGTGACKQGKYNVLNY